MLFLCSGTFVSFLAGLGQKSSVLTVHVALPKTGHQHLQNRQQALRAYCPKILYCYILCLQAFVQDIATYTYVQWSITYSVCSAMGNHIIDFSSHDGFCFNFINWVKGRFLNSYACIKKICTRESVFMSLRIKWD